MVMRPGKAVESQNLPLKDQVLPFPYNPCTRIGLTLSHTSSDLLSAVLYCKADNNPKVGF